MIRRMTASAVGLAAGALALAAPASAHHNIPTVTATADGCTVTVTTAWSQDTHLVGNTVAAVLAGGMVHTAPIGEALVVQLEPGTTAVSWRVWGGGERAYDSPDLADLDALVAYLDGGGSPLDADAPGVAWHQLEVPDCPTPDPTPDPTTDPTPDPDPTPEPPAGDPGDEAPGAGGGADDGSGSEALPVTGSPLPLLGAGGLALLSAGGGLWWLARRRSEEFVA